MPSLDNDYIISFVIQRPFWGSLGRLMIIRENATANRIIGPSSSRRVALSVPVMSISTNAHLVLIYYGRPRDPPRQFHRSAFIAMSDGSHVNKGEFANPT
jgi:hypothetical protein